MNVRIDIVTNGQVELHDVCNVRDIEASCGNVCRDKQIHAPGRKCLQCLHSLTIKQPHTHASMISNEIGCALRACRHVRKLTP